MAGVGQVALDTGGEATITGGDARRPGPGDIECTFAKRLGDRDCCPGDIDCDGGENTPGGLGLPDCEWRSGEKDADAERITWGLGVRKAADREALITGTMDRCAAAGALDCARCGVLLLEVEMGTGVRAAITGLRTRIARPLRPARLSGTVGVLLLERMGGDTVAPPIARALPGLPGLSNMSSRARCPGRLETGTGGAGLPAVLPELPALTAREVPRYLLPSSGDLTASGCCCCCG